MHVFTYGTLMFPAVWQRVVRGEYDSSEAWLSGFERRAVRGAIYPCLIHSESSRPVQGILYYDVNGLDMDRLDELEGEQYQRLLLPCDLPGGKKIDAFVYVWSDENTSQVGGDWDLNWFQEQGLALFLKQYLGFR